MSARTKDFWYQICPEVLVPLFLSTATIRRMLDALQDSYNFTFLLHLETSARVRYCDTNPYRTKTLAPRRGQSS